MRNLKDFVSDWIRDKETDECRGDMVNCGNELVMVRLEGDGGLLNYGLPDAMIMLHCLLCVGSCILH